MKAMKGIRNDIAASKMPSIGDKRRIEGPIRKNCQWRATELLRFLGGVVKSQTELAEELPRLSVLLLRAKQSSDDGESELS